MDKKHYCVLKYIYRHPYVSYKNLKSRFRKNSNDIENIVTDLENSHMISFRIASNPNADDKSETLYPENNSHLLCLSPGNEYIESEYKINIRWRVTTGIALLAAIGAYRKELVFLLQATGKLLIKLTGN